MKYQFSLLFIPVLFLFACNNASENKEASAPAPAANQADSLMHEVMDGHDAAMIKTNKIASAQKRVKQSIDSIDKLPSNTNPKNTALKMQLNTLATSLQYAGTAMDKWMEDFNMDSAKNDVKVRTEYLESEKQKITRLNEQMSSALQKTDSLLK